MDFESQASRNPLGSMAALRARIVRYREQAAHFTRLAETEPVETIRGQWKTLAHDYAYLARTLEPQSRGPAVYPIGRTSPVAGDD